MRGRARWNPRENLTCKQGVESELEDFNYGRCSDLPEKVRLQHCTYYVDASGERVQALTVFCARAGSTVYLSRKERNRMQHALVGNTGASSDIIRHAKGAAVMEKACMFDVRDRLGRWRNKCLQVSVLRMCPPSMKDAVRNRLSRACRNNCRSGFAGGAVEAKNFQSVVTVLRCFGMRW